MIQPYEDFIASKKREYMVQLLLEANGRQSRAAEIAQVHRNTIKRMIVEVGIRLDDVRRVKRQSYMPAEVIPIDLIGEFQRET